MNEVRNVFNKRGFTLVELLAVIIILGIILVLAVPRVSDMINKYRDKAYERQLDLILNAAEQYSIFYEDEINWLGDYASITLKELQEKDLIASPTKNPKGGDFDSENFIITLTRLANGLIKYSINIEGHYTAQELQDMIDQGYKTVATASDLDDIRDDVKVTKDDKPDKNDYNNKPVKDENGDVVGYKFNEEAYSKALSEYIGKLTNYMSYLGDKLSNISDQTNLNETKKAFKEALRQYYVALINQENIIEMDKSNFELSNQKLKNYKLQYDLGQITKNAYDDKIIA